MTYIAALSNGSYKIDRQTRQVVVERSGKGSKGIRLLFLLALTRADKAWNGGKVEGSSIRDWSWCCARQQIHQRRWAAWRFVWYSSRRCRVSCEMGQKCLLTGDGKTFNTPNTSRAPRREDYCRPATSWESNYTQSRIISRVRGEINFFNLQFREVYSSLFNVWNCINNWRQCSFLAEETRRYWKTTLSRVRI